MQNRRWTEKSGIFFHSAFASAMIGQPPKNVEQKNREPPLYSWHALCCPKTGSAGFCYLGRVALDILV